MGNAGFLSSTVVSSIVDPCSALLRPYKNECIALFLGSVSKPKEVPGAVSGGDDKDLRNVPWRASTGC